MEHLNQVQQKDYPDWYYSSSLVRVSKERLSGEIQKNQQLLMSFPSFQNQRCNKHIPTDSYPRKEELVCYLEPEYLNAKKCRLNKKEKMSLL